MTTKFAVGFWGRVAQYGSATIILLAVLILIISWLFRNDNPRAVRKFQKFAIWLGLSVPITVVIVAAISIIVFVIAGLLGWDWF